MDRRNFLSKAGLAAIAAGTLSQLPFAAEAKGKEKQYFVRHNFYWMKNPDKPEELEQLIKGMKELCSVKQVRYWQVGKPLDYKENVMEKSFAVSLMMVFDSKEDFDKYHKDPLHAKFVKECGSLWSKLTGFSTVNV